MVQNKIRVEVDDLGIGMYVCELDIPWLESPFLFQGFPLNCEDDITDVKKVCQYVYVDPQQSSTALQARLQQLSQQARQHNTGHAAEQKREPSAASYDFREHLHLARQIYNHTRRYVSKTHEEVRIERPVNVRAARSLVHDLAQNILVNPNAMLWLTHLKDRHEYTLTHSINVCILALIFGRHLKLQPSDLEMLGLGALLHDIGKLRIPLEILDKPGRLTEQEFEVMKTHPVEGHRILKDDPQMPYEALEIVLHHHERINGKGYPDQLNDAQITRLIKISSIVDVYDAITSDRCYHDGLSPYKALQNIYSWTSGHFDKALVEEFMACMGIYPVGTVVRLNDGQCAIVIGATPKTRLRPTVLLIKDREDKFYKQRRIYNLSSQEWDRREKRLEIVDVLEAKACAINVKQILEQESLSPQQNPSRHMDGMDSFLN